MSIHDAERIDTVTFETGILELQVQDLLSETSLGEHVFRTVREPVLSTGRSVVEYHVGALPVEAWSTGEKGLWLFLASLSGHQPINLYGLAAQFAGTPEAGHIAELTRILFTEGA